MMELFGSAWSFLVIIDPPGCAPIFASLTRGTPPPTPGDGDPFVADRLGDPDVLRASRKPMLTRSD